MKKKICFVGAGAMAESPRQGTFGTESSETGTNFCHKQR